MTYKQEFITFMVRSGVLTFGDFTTKSGRKTPYFVNTGNYKTGAQAARLLREQYGIETEMASGCNVLAMTSCADTEKERSPTSWRTRRRRRTTGQKSEDWSRTATASSRKVLRARISAAPTSTG